MLKYDKPLLAALIGVLVGIPFEIYTQLFKLAGLNQLSAYELTSIMMYPQGSWWIGLLTFNGMTAMAGNSIYQMTRILGSDYMAIKGAGFGMTTYGLTAAIFGTLGQNPRFAELTVSGHYVHASTGILGGMLAAVAIKKYLLEPREAPPQDNSRTYTLVPGPVWKKQRMARWVPLKKPKKF